MPLERRDILIVGSGFAGSILARILAGQGRDVVLVERGHHPRFALGESSTPLAALSLERLARRYGLDDLRNLATYGRWSRHLPQLRKGLKRGFTFYQHSPGERFENSQENDRRLLVAASPEDEIADVHWLREDVDAFLVGQAVEAGVDYRPGTELTSLRELPDGVRVAGLGSSGEVHLEAKLLIDASGGRGFVARCLPLPFRRPDSSSRQEAPTRLIFSHFAGVMDFAQQAREDGARWSPAPYPDDRAAVHHLLEEGWLYVLPFDHGVVSAGLLTRGPGSSLPPEPEAAWEAVLGRYPSLERCFRSARPVRPLGQWPSISYQRSASVGSRWLLLPHAYAFFDPLFSTGMAWSLLAVERVASMLTEGARGTPSREELHRYQELLSLEASQISDLVEGAYLALRDFRRFSAVSSLYFAAASFQELRQRLLDPPSQGWFAEGFLGSTDSLSRNFVREGRRRLETSEESSEAFETWARAAIAPRNVIGLADPRRQNLYPVDLDVLMDRCALLGLCRDELERRLPRLRG